MRLRFGLCAAAAVLGMAASAHSAGFALIEQSASGMGNAFAGAAAVAEDASTVYFNPAGMVFLKGQQVVAAGHVIAPQAEFSNQGSTHATAPATAGSLTGGNGPDGGELGLVPNFYYTAKLGDRLALGFGMNAPFGMATEYDSTWVGRYHAIRSELQTVNMNPSVAVRLNDHVSLGAGLNVQYLKAELSNAIDFGTALFLRGAPGALPQRNDGSVVLEGDSWDYGYNLGAMLELDKDTRFGLTYRSKMEHDVEGTADFTLPTAYAGALGALGYSDTSVTATAALPETVSGSFYHRFDPKLAVLADATWTRWSRFQELRFKFASGIADGVTTENWKDSWRYSAGAIYNANEKLTVRAGVAYDNTPIPSEEFRTPRIPDEDRFWMALGFGYKFSDRLGMDFGYAHLFVKDPVINKSPSGEDASRGGLKGTYEASVDIASVQLVYNF